MEIVTDIITDVAEVVETPDFVHLLPMFASAFKSKIFNKGFVVNSVFGKGNMWAESLPSGISVIVSDTSLTQEVVIERPETHEQFFILQLTEESEIELEETKQKRRADEYQSHVKLSHTISSEAFIFPANKRLRSVKFLFNVDHLYSLLGHETVNTLVSEYFSIVFKEENLEPIATQYRVMLDDLWSGEINQPLRINYIQNRILLLLEKYILKLHERSDLQTKKPTRRDDETLRLMKVEALLVKNFAVAPPTIDELSRISAMSPTKLKNDFKSVYGLPIYEYYQKNRMLKAKSLLVLEKFNIKEVGMMVGYTNLSHFANSFKKQFGHLPSELAAKDGMLVYGDK